MSEAEMMLKSHCDEETSNRSMLVPDRNYEIVFIEITILQEINKRIKQLETETTINGSDAVDVLYFIFDNKLKHLLKCWPIRLMKKLEEIENALRRLERGRNDADRKATKLTDKLDTLARTVQVKS